MSRLETTVPPVVWWLVAALLVLQVDTTVGDDLAEGWGRVVAILLLLGGGGVAVAALTGFGRAKTTVDPHNIDKASALVTDGVYRFTRNPMYLGLLAFIVGWGLWRGTILAALIGAVVFVAVLTRFQIIPEERMLREKFGAEYDAFVARTRRWI